MVGSYGLYCLEGDYINVINVDLVFCVNGVYEDVESFRDQVESNKLFIIFFLVYVLSKDIKFFYELEIIDQEVNFDCGILILNGQFGVVFIDMFYGEFNDGLIEIKGVVYQLLI